MLFFLYLLILHYFIHLHGQDGHSPLICALLSAVGGRPCRIVSLENNVINDDKNQYCKRCDTDLEESEEEPRAPHFVVNFTTEREKEMCLKLLELGANAKNTTEV